MTTIQERPPTENPLPYAKHDEEWAIWSEIAQRFERKVPAQDRGDIKHSIILELALARARDGNKPFSEAMMCRVASFVVADYWRRETRRATTLSVDAAMPGAEDDPTELMDTLADDKAIDLEAWVDARTFLLGCPQRLVQIAHKRLDGAALDHKDREYLRRFRQREQKRLIEPCLFSPPKRYT